MRKIGRYRLAIFAMVSLSLFSVSLQAGALSGGTRIQGYLLRAAVDAETRMADWLPAEAAEEHNEEITDNTSITFPAENTSTTSTTTAPVVADPPADTTASTTIPSETNTTVPAVKDPPVATTPSTTTSSTTTTTEVENQIPGDSFPWVMTASSIGLQAEVFGGENSNSVVDKGDIWAWPGTGTPAIYSHVVTFAHRTSKGGTFLDIHKLTEGDLISVSGPTGETWNYRVAGKNVVTPEAGNIYAEARAYGGPSISLVACSKENGEPTSLSYRLVVTAVRI